MAWFFYEKSFAGKWVPRKQARKPKTKGAEGIQKPAVCQVIEIPKHQQKLKLETLAHLYPLRENA